MPAGETPVLLCSDKGQSSVGKPDKNLQEEHNSNPKIYEVVTLLVLPGLDLALENSLSMQSQVVFCWIQVHGIYQKNVLGSVDIQQDLL